MDSLVAIHQLADVHITGHAGEHISVVAAKMLFRYKEVNHVAHRQARGFTQIIVESHADVVSRGFRTRIVDFQILAHHKLNGSKQGGLQGSNVYLAVPLSGMTIANQEERSGSVDREIQRGSGNQFFVVHISSLNPWRGAVEPAISFRRRLANTAEKWMQ